MRDDLCVIYTYKSVLITSLLRFVCLNDKNTKLSKDKHTMQSIYF